MVPTVTRWCDGRTFAGTGSGTAPVTNPATGETTGRIAGRPRGRPHRHRRSPRGLPAWRDSSLTAAPRSSSGSASC
nr:hypothetical protein [Streptomyces alanosinicus]